ncbi:hypothetical protein FQR65_LT01655 [Abscondita terminalis]|nr:hypothetical protein FQR65_LT01655 [Abscondita terminalis]
MKFLKLFVCLCALAVHAQENLKITGNGTVKVTSIEPENENVIEQLLKSLYVATSDDVVNSNSTGTGNSTNVITSSTRSSLSVTTGNNLIEPQPEKDARQSKAYVSLPQNAILGNSLLNTIIKKIATIPPETFDRLMRFLNISANDQETTELPSRSNFATNELESITPESITPMLFTSEIEEATPELTTQDSRISEIISIISNVVSSSNLDENKTNMSQIETTTQESIFTVLPISTFENSSSESVILVGPYAPKIPASTVKTIAHETTTATPSSSILTSTENDATTPFAPSQITLNISETDVLSNRVLTDSNTTKPYSQSLDSVLPYKPDFFVFGVLPNGTIVRKRPLIINPAIVIGVLPNDTLIQKFPNGSILPLPTETVIQVNGFDTRENIYEGLQQRSLSVDLNNETMVTTTNGSYIASPEDILEESPRNESQIMSTTTKTIEINIPTPEFTLSPNASQENITPDTTTSKINNLITTGTVVTTTSDMLLNSLDLTSTNEEIRVNALAISPLPSNPVTLMEMLTKNVTNIATSISNNITQNINQNMRLNDKQKEDLEIIESLLKKQQIVLEQLAVVAKLNLAATLSPARGNLTERVMEKVVEMSSSTSAPAEKTTLLTSTGLEITSTTTPKVITNKSKLKQAIITEKQIELLISQLEAIKKNPEKIKKLDIDGLRKLQKFENSMQSANDVTTIMKMINMDEKISESKVLNNRFTKDSEPITTSTSTTTSSTTTTTSTTTTSATVTPTISSKMLSTSNMDPKIKEELLNYAINISEAISSFLGSALQVL